MGNFLVLHEILTGKVTLTILVCFKLPNFIINTGNDDDCDKNYGIPTDTSNRIQGEEEVLLQTKLHKEEVPKKQSEDNDELRAQIALKINHMGYTCVNRPS